MTEHDTQVAQILKALQERAKELNCLYRVDELLNEPGKSLYEVLRRVTDILPEGWQFSNIAQAQITFEGLVIQTQGFTPTQWVQTSPIIVQGQRVGSVEISYRERMPNADEGPFLSDERKLIDTVAERIAGRLLHLRLKAAFDSWNEADDKIAEGTEWRPIFDFLRETDPALLQRISRKLLNHLSWTGIPDAKELLRGGAASFDAEAGLSRENRPLQNSAFRNATDLTKEAFRIATKHLTEDEILNCITTWIKEEKSSFLVRALENQDTPLGEIVEAVEHYQHAAIDEADLSTSIRKGLRVSLIRRFFSENLDFINVAKHFIDIKDFHELLGHIIFPPRCHGKLGGKSAGLFLAKKIIEKTPESDLLRDIKVPKTWYLTSDWILNFVHHNDLEDVLNRKYMDIDQIRQEYPHLVALFKSSSFPSELSKGLALALDDLGDTPLIVRSSSLLEDRAGSAFSGKYKSLFLGNQGTKPERLAALMDAIAEVYASIFGPDPTEYRAERGLLDVHEEMGIMIQPVVGKKVGKYFLPACSGVAFSNNEFRWSPRIKREDGLIRLVPGLGTRAVDRVTDDYPVLIAPGQPTLRVNTSVDEKLKYSPKHVDVINLEANVFETVDASALLGEYGAEYPGLRQLVSIYQNECIHEPIGNLLDFKADFLFTFEGLIQKTPFVARMRELLGLLQSKLKSAVDIEFAYDGDSFYLLQCRPQSYSADVVPVSIPQNVPENDLLFSTKKFVSNGRVPDITHIVYVDPDAYSQLSSEDAMRQVGHAVGRLNKILPKRQFILIGPGRWGSRGDIKLGVPVTYSDINNTALLVEIARQRGNYVPDLSFGTHFFQDLVEASIRYLPLYPDDSQTQFDEVFLRRSDTVLKEVLPEFDHLSDTLRVIDVARERRGRVLRVLLNGDLEKGIAYFAPQQEKSEAEHAAVETVDRSGNEHWRWRFRMAQTIGSQIDPERFGVKALYLIGSTKNATAGPASDIDLLIHFAGTEEQRSTLTVWLEGWSRCLDEMNFLRTGYRSGGLLDTHIITDHDVLERSSYAVKINAVTDAARKLKLGPA